MLVLSRKVGEKLVIGDNVTITINRVSGNRVTIGIQAPSDVRIVRGELERFEDSDRVTSPSVAGDAQRGDHHRAPVLAHRHS